MIDSLIKDLVITQIGTKKICFDLRNLVAIVNPKNILETFLGEFSFNGTNYSIIDFYNIHKLEAPKDEENTRFLLFELNRSFIAVMVDRVLEIISLKESINIGDVDKENSHYVVKWDGREFLVPDLQEYERIKT